MTALFIFAGIELAALLVLIALIMVAREEVEDERGVRVAAPSLWQQLRQKWSTPTKSRKVPPFPSMHGPTHA